MDDALTDRRQQALAAAYDIDDASVWGGYPHASLTTAIEVATQVKITDDIIDMIPATRSDAYDLACDIFRAAGFEVVE